jgi:CLIP-associating protein 1/2
VLESVEAVVDIVPLRVYSESDLIQEMELVEAGLQASEEDWQARCDALRRIQQLLVGGAKEFSAFVPLLRGMHERVAELIVSRRSALSREGCTTVAVLAQVGPGPHSVTVK